MNLRTIFLSGIVLLGLGAAFGFKSEKKILFSSDWILNVSGTNQCMTGAYSGYANEPNCSPSNTGPVCTVTPGALSTRTAYFPYLPASCTMPWRQP